MQKEVGRSDKAMVTLGDLSTMTVNLWHAYWHMKDKGYDALADELYDIITKNRIKLEKRGLWS